MEEAVENAKKIEKPKDSAKARVGTKQLESCDLRGNVKKLVNTLAHVIVSFL
ncbi:MAG: hypothetical protein QXX79_06635 [Candidatus Bathyarchaeia archaeon]